MVGGDCFVLGVWWRVLGRHISDESIFRRGPAWAKSNFGIRTHLGQSTLRQIQRARSCVLVLGPHWGSRESPRKPGSPRKNRESPEKRTFGRQSKKSGFQGREVTDPLKAVEGKIGQRPEIAGQPEKKKGRPAVSRIYAVDFTRFLRPTHPSPKKKGCVAFAVMLAENSK